MTRTLLLHILTISMIVGLINAKGYNLSLEKRDPTRCCPNGIFSGDLNTACDPTGPSSGDGMCYQGWIIHCTGAYESGNVIQASFNSTLSECFDVCTTSVADATALVVDSGDILELFECLCLASESDFTTNAGGSISMERLPSKCTKPGTPPLPTCCPLYTGDIADACDPFTMMPGNGKCTSDGWFIQCGVHYASGTVLGTLEATDLPDCFEDCLQSFPTAFSFMNFLSTPPFCQCFENAFDITAYSAGYYSISKSGLPVCPPVVSSSSSSSIASKTTTRPTKTQTHKTKAQQHPSTSTTNNPTGAPGTSGSSGGQGGSGKEGGSAAQSGSEGASSSESLGVSGESTGKGSFWPTATYVNSASSIRLWSFAILMPIIALLAHL